MTRKRRRRPSRKERDAQKPAEPKRPDARQLSFEELDPDELQEGFDNTDLIDDAFRDYRNRGTP